MGRAKITALLGLLAFVPIGAPAAPGDATRAYIAAHKKDILQEYLKLVALPDLHGDVPALKRNATLLLAMMKQRGLDAEQWDTSGAPVMFGQKLVPGAKHTILFYAHYDGQPVDPKRWQQPDPFVPVIRTGTIEAGGKTIADPLNTPSPMTGGFMPAPPATTRCRLKACCRRSTP